MSVLVVPPLDPAPWPTLGLLICEWIERNLVFGPGDLRGQPARLDAEKRALIYRAYEIYPPGHPQAGRRRFKRVAISLRKGSAKTEFAAWLAAAELHPDAPVRCVGWEDGQPVGGGVTDPYIPLVAANEQQSEELAYGALRVILMYSTVAADFDIGLERIMRIGGDGKAEALASSPNARDGARTSFQVFDETHRHILPHLKAAHRTMLANIPKRKGADAWSLEITTAPAPGENSVAEDTMEYARAVLEGRIADPRLFFFHRQAGDHHDLTTEAGIRAAVLEASGPVAEWSDIDGIVAQWADPTQDRAYLQRVWLNQLVRASERAFDAEKWKALAKPDYVVPEGATVTLGFDGARYHDATALIGCEVQSGHLFTVGIWQRPPNIQQWEVPEAEVEDALAGAMAKYSVWRAYCDPPYWETKIAEWAGQYGDQKVWSWRTNRMRPMAAAVTSFDNAIDAGELSHDGNRLLTAHVGNACRRWLSIRDEKGEKVWVIYKDRPDSEAKIDGCMAAILAWEARRDALAAGVVANATSVYEERGLIIL